MDEIRLSPSAIITFMRCPREFYYVYIKRLPIPLTAPLVKGSTIHKVLELFFSKKQPRKLDEKDMDSLFVKCIDTAIKTYSEDWKTLSLSKEDFIKETDDMKNMLSLYYTIFKLKLNGLIDSGKAENLRHAFFLLRPQQKEAWIHDKELNLCGYIDRIYTDFNGTVTIGDYKTGSKYGIGIKDEYELQCGLYALLYKRYYKTVPDFTSIIFLRYGEEIRTRVTPSHITNALDTFEYVRGKTKTDNVDDYPLHEGKFCKWCSFFNKCSGIETKETSIRQHAVLKKLTANVSLTPEGEKIAPDIKK